MYQPEVKYHFVNRYLNPSQGWVVFVDLDPSELGLAGGRMGANVDSSQTERQREGDFYKTELVNLGVKADGGLKKWLHQIEPQQQIHGDRDVVAFHRETRTCVIAEVEGVSSIQPEQSLYRAIGQLVIAISNTTVEGWSVRYLLVVDGDRLEKSLSLASALSKLGIEGLSIVSDAAGDKWFNSSCNWRKPASHFSNLL